MYNVIDIGSGPWPKQDATVRMDFNDWPNVDCKHDLTVTPYPFNANMFDKAYMGDVLEHISIFDLDRVLQEVHRILKSPHGAYLGGILEITVPDAMWIFERIHKDDWKIASGNIDWLNQKETDWDNAMAYLFGGFHTESEYRMPGMGHVNAFCEKSLIKVLEKNGYISCRRITDLRNPGPARDSILRVTCYKG